MKTVLIAEDEKLIRQGIRTMIQRSGVPVEVVMECGNGEMALEILQKQEVDVLFTDIHMPKLTGIELVQRIQTLPKKPIVVVISGYADFTYAVEMLHYGAREYLLKPIEREKLWDVMRRLEQELAEDRESSMNSKRLGHQQLKYLMLNEKVTEEELHTLQAEYESKFDLQAYYVCALNPREKKASAEKYIYLHNVEEHDVYLVSEQNAPMLLKNELAQEYVGISALHSGIMELKAAYREAAQARHHAFCTNRVCSAGEHGKHDFYAQGQKLTGEEMKLQRVHLLGTDKTEELIKGWNRLFYAVRNGQIAPEDFTSCMDDFFEEVQKIYRDMLAGEENTLKRLAEYYSYPSLSVWQTAFMEWLLALHERINSQLDTNKTQQKIKEAMDYIRTHYDQDLNMAVVSNHISMNYSMFSHLFKAYTGSNFVNYLKGVRMQEAQRLLAETDLRVNEISARIGYDNEKYFLKTFKASYGVSPSEYRKNVRPQTFT